MRKVSSLYSKTSFRVRLVNCQLQSWLHSLMEVRPEHHKWCRLLQQEGPFGRCDAPGDKEKERAGTQVIEGSQDEGRAVTQLGSLRTYRLNGEITWENAGEVNWKSPAARDGNLVLLAYSFLSQSWVKTSLASLPWGGKGSDGKEWVHEQMWDEKYRATMWEHERH